MRALFTLCFVLLPWLAYTQDYAIEDGNVVVTKIVENVDANKDEIYGRVKSYFTHAYGSANAVIQTDDKEGGLVIGKGLYLKLASFNLGVWTMEAHHILRADIKDGRVRIICSANTINAYPPTDPRNGCEYNIIDFSPITDKRARCASKNAQKEAFKKLVENLNASVNALEDVVKKGGVLQSERKDW